MITIVVKAEKITTYSLSRFIMLQ